MQEKLSEILDNILGLLLLEGSYDIQEDSGALYADINTEDAGRIIGYKGEFLNSLQLIVSLMLVKKNDGEFKRVILDVAGWRKQKEDDLVQKAKNWSSQVLESGEDLELEPMPSWQRRIIHVTLQQIEGVQSESVGEGRDRHLIIKSSSK